MKRSAPYETIKGTSSGLRVYGTARGVVGGGGEPGGQRAGAGIGWVDLAAEHGDRDVAGPRQLERGRGRRSAGAPYPVVVRPDQAGTPRPPARNRTGPG